MLMTNDDEENFIEETSLQNYKHNDKFFLFYHYCYKSNKLEIQKINYQKIIKIKRRRRDSKC